jgi:two-component system NtrC family sensor kinase
LFYSTRFKLIVSFLTVSLIAGFVSILVGTMLLFNAVLNEATNRVRSDLSAAREIYLTRLSAIRAPLINAAQEPLFCSAINWRNTSKIVPRLESLAKSADLDFMGIVGRDGRTLLRMGKGSAIGEGEISNPIADMARERRIPISGTVILSREFLSHENPELADRARISFVPTQRSVPKDEGEETSGIALATAVPIIKNGKLLSVLYGGTLLNRSHAIVDRVRDTLFQDEIYKGRSIGAVTIFFGDLRIATNVLTPDGKRAIGTRVSSDVKEHVLTEGKRWTAPAFVVSDWYISAYEPIEDIFGKRVGMLYVGVLEEKYTDIRWKAFSVLVIITLAGMALSIGLGYFLADRFMKPVNRLIKASEQVSQGNLSIEIGPLSKDEIGVLQKTFNDMIVALEERDIQSRAESEIRLLQSEKQASIGRLAAGVAHEINNPLTGVLTYSHMLLRRNDLSDDIRADLETIAKATDRVRKIVKGLLDFSRQTKLNPESTDVNELVNSAINLLQNQALVRGISLRFVPAENLPMLTLDPSQLQSVIMNMIINAFDATDSGGTITVSTGIGIITQRGEQKGVEILISDTGCGIASENLDKLFDPFFTTKEVGQGTGLGLAVSYGIIERHGGTIIVQSEVGTGSTFTIWLPIEVQNGQI